MIEATPSIEKAGQIHCPAFSSYPQFVEAPLPSITLNGAIIHAERAWQGLIQPFVNDADARLVLRALAADQAVDVAAGEVTASFEVHQIARHNAESRMEDCSIVFDVLVLDFPAPTHPWAFSLAPIISNQKCPSHPHLRCDRTLVLPSRTLSGMCIYSAAEFRYDSALPRIPQFLDQVSIYLAKHVIWLKTQRLFNLDTHTIVHNGLDLDTLYKDIPADSFWQKQPQLKTGWLGFWPGRKAVSGKDHLSLDPDGECWCGTGSIYGKCCRPLDIKRYGFGTTE